MSPKFRPLALQSMLLAPRKNRPILLEIPIAVLSGIRLQGTHNPPAQESVSVCFDGAVCKDLAG